MSDLISRQAAIEAIEREKSLIERPITETRWFDLGLGKAQDVLSELPSAQPTIDSVRHGKWVAKRDGWNGGFVVCSVCFAENGMNSKFCPHCGARME